MSHVRLICSREVIQSASLRQRLTPWITDLAYWMEEQEEEEEGEEAVEGVEKKAEKGEKKVEGVEVVVVVVE